MFSHLVFFSLLITQSTYFKIGNKISLISKKNIRYEGTLYSINEQNSTVALQNVISYGTEGREKTDPDTSYVAPQEGIHAYLLFRGCDIKDLHVHEVPKPPAAAAAAESESLPAPPPAPQQQQSTAAKAKAGDGKSSSSSKGKENQPKSSSSSSSSAPAQAQQSQASSNKRSTPTTATTTANNNNNNPQQPQQRKPGGAQVGTGASLLNRKARGSLQGGTREKNT